MAAIASSIYCAAVCLVTLNCSLCRSTYNLFIHLSAHELVIISVLASINGSYLTIEASGSNSDTNALSFLLTTLSCFPEISILCDR